MLGVLQTKEKSHYFSISNAMGLMSAINCLYVYRRNISDSWGTGEGTFEFCQTRVSQSDWRTFPTAWTLCWPSFHLCSLAELRWRCETQVHGDALRAQVRYLSSTWYEHPFMMGEIESVLTCSWICLLCEFVFCFTLSPVYRFVIWIGYGDVFLGFISIMLFQYFTNFISCNQIEKISITEKCSYYHILCIQL